MTIFNLRFGISGCLTSVNSSNEAVGGSRQRNVNLLPSVGNGAHVGEECTRLGSTKRRIEPAHEVI
ncbi:hypothetical protein FR483_n510L [Paramecium bursaria Chlorella virus FR483]|uniref:Uncharacterized protein n510L n=1 Tax=Paramecium bursaria Chlorella virus FR483 TaxID=399781 RepID=A7J7L4_PBCVF|nr:hypothetical protein FR483_n510L [Paramecium bursaria Chlorella virus FR483]ABT15795.1 hypothetical protein FR483_n510L [Paramecium bursaria Chlorella virus FR483]